MHTRWPFCAVACVLAAAIDVQSATWYVDPGGGGDFQTLQEAVDAAATRDTVRLSAGLHDWSPGFVEIDASSHASSLVILGEGGGVTTVTGGGQGIPVLIISGTDAEMTIADLTFTGTANPGLTSHAFSLNYGGIRVERCTFEDSFQWAAFNLSGPTAVQLVDCTLDVRNAVQGIEVGGADATLDIRDSYILGSGQTILAGSWGGNIQNCLIENGRVVADDVSTRIVGTTFRGLSSWALLVVYATVEQCLFVSSTSSSNTPFISLEDGATLRRCTIADVTQNAEVPLIAIESGANDVVVANNIVAFNNGIDIRVETHDIDVVCNLFWENGGLSHLGIPELDPTNIISAPLFCNSANGDYTLDAASPAAPANSGGCGLIGALPVACGAPLTAPIAGGAEPSLRVTPNPFNPVTLLHITVDDVSAPVDLSIYDIAGRQVRNLLEEERLAANSIVWDGRDDAGRSVGNGGYFVRMASGGEQTVGRAVLVK